MICFGVKVSGEVGFFSSSSSLVLSNEEEEEDEEPSLAFGSCVAEPLAKPFTEPLAELSTFELLHRLSQRDLAPFAPDSDRSRRCFSCFFRSSSKRGLTNRPGLRSSSTKQGLIANHS